MEEVEVVAGVRCDFVPGAARVGGFERRLATRGGPLLREREALRRGGNEGVLGAVREVGGWHARREIRGDTCLVFDCGIAGRWIRRRTIEVSREDARCPAGRGTPGGEVARSDHVQHALHLG